MGFGLFFLVSYLTFFMHGISIISSLIPHLIVFFVIYYLFFVSCCLNLVNTPIVCNRSRLLIVSSFKTIYHEKGILTTALLCITFFVPASTILEHYRQCRHQSFDSFFRHYRCAAAKIQNSECRRRYDPQRQHFFWQICRP